MSGLFFRCAVSFAVVFTLPNFASAEPAYSRLSGWSEPVTLDTSISDFSSTMAAEVDGNTSNGKEVVAATGNGIVTVFSASGSTLWQKEVPFAACDGKRNQVRGTPAIAPLTSGGIPHVVVPYGVGCDGGVIAFRGSDGSTAWNFNLRSTSKKLKFKQGERNWRVFSSPAIADTDGDGKSEIAFGSYNRNVYLLEHNGSVRMLYHAADTIWSSPGFVDTNNDGRLEMFIATDISKNVRLKPATQNGGNLYALNTKKQKQKVFNFRDKKAFRWMTPVPEQVLYSAPVAGDVDTGSSGREIVIRSGCYFKDAAGDKPGKWIKVFRASNGALLRTIPMAECSTASVALGDLNGNGVLEIISTDERVDSGTGSQRCHVIAWDGTTGAELWSTALSAGSCSGFRAPVVGDLNGNGSLEIVAIEGSRATILRGNDGEALSCASDDCTASQVDLSDFTSLQHTPVLEDLNQDGVLDLIVNSGSRIHALTGFQLDSAAGPEAPYSAPWPMFRRNAAHTAVQ